MTIYLDYNATSPLRERARDAAVDAFACVGNASSVHRQGRIARSIIENARDDIARFLNIQPTSVVFTSGATEANNLVLGGFTGRRILVSATEHPSVLQACGGQTQIPVDQDGVLRVDILETLLATSEQPVLVSVMAANNETGVIQPVSDVLDVARKCGALVHTDAVQSIGRTDGRWMDADFITVSSHKLGGLAGAGALIMHRPDMIAPRLRGGGQEFGYRAGTEALPAIASFGAALLDAANDEQVRIQNLRDEIQTRMCDIAPGSIVLGGNTARLANTLCIAHPAVDSETLVMTFDLDGIAISAGAACSSGKMSASHVVAAMGLPELASHAVRFSLGWNTTADHCHAAVATWSRAHALLAGRRAAA